MRTTLPTARFRAHVLLAILGLAASVPAQEALDDRSSRAQYRIEARYDEDTHRLDGRETLVWTNRSGDTVNDLWFHLYWNAYSNNQSTHLTESKGKLRGRKIDSGWGWQRVTGVSVAGEDLLPTLQWQTTPGGLDRDRTVFSVDLAQPVAPGGAIEIDLEWESLVPRVRRRTGYKDDFLLIAHWFPKLGVYEGGRGWNCHQFHMNSEFYADYGKYDVTLDLPEAYQDRVGATGVREGLGRVSGGRVKTRFVAPSITDEVRARESGREVFVHGFTWTADPDYHVQVGSFQYDDWAQRYPDEVERVARALGRSPGELRLRDVAVHALIQPERKAQAERHIEATCAALFFYGLWFGEYPYEKITVVDPAWGGSGAGGMEYPMIFTAGTRLYTRPEMHRPESVTVHEAGHQFWYGLVGNNEFEAAWMDEGFNSYTDSEVLFRHYGLQRKATWYSGLPVWGGRPAPLPGGGRVADVLSAAEFRFPFDLSIKPLDVSPFVEWWRDQPRLTFVEEYTDTRWGDRRGYLSDPDSDPIERFVWEYVDRQSYRTNSYPRTAVALRSLAAVTGPDAFLKGIRTYSEQWRYRHPYPDDFFDSFQASTEEDVAWYFDEVFRGTGTVDWRVDVSQRRQPKPKGFLLTEAGEFVEIEPAEGPDDEDGDEEADDDESADDNENEEDADSEEEPGKPKAPYEYDVVVRKDGTLRLPVVIRVVFDDDRTQDFEWTREMQVEHSWWRLPLVPSPEKVRSVVIDPERLYYLDEDMSDNQWYDDSDELVPLRWTERIATQYVHLLHWFSSTGG